MPLGSVTLRCCQQIVGKKEMAIYKMAIYQITDVGVSVKTAKLLIVLLEIHE